MDIDDSKIALTRGEASDLLTGFSLALVRSLQMRGQRDHWFVARDLGNALKFIGGQQPKGDMVASIFDECADVLIGMAEENDPRCAVNLAEEAAKL